MEDKRLQKLQAALELADRDTVSSDELSEILAVFSQAIEVIRESSEERDNALLSKLESDLTSLSSRFSDVLEEKTSKKEVNKLRSELNSLVESIKDEIREELREIEQAIPEPTIIPELDILDVRNRLEVLPEKEKLSIKSLSGTELFATRTQVEIAVVELGGHILKVEKRLSRGYGALGGGSEGTGSQFLLRQRDVNANNIINGQTLVWDAASKSFIPGTASGGSSITLTTIGSSGAATLIGGVLNIPVYSGGGTPGGLTTQLQYNNAGVFGGMSRVTTNGNDLILTSQASPTYTAGKLVYDQTMESLTFYNNDSNVALQIGQEEWIRVVNNTGSTIPNGAAVYINGASAGMPTVALAQSNAGATTIGAGLATEAITNGATGYVTCIGNVNGLDTSAFTAGQTVYISSTVAGGLTATAPTAPNYRYRVGIVGVSSATIGTIHVTPSTAALGNGTANQVFGMNTAGTAQEVKSIVGTTNRLTVTNTTNTITLDIAATYVGQTSITTLGTITTGTWNGTTIAPANGGTGTTTAFTLGSVVFAGASGIYTQDNTNFFWDNTNKTLGLGTAGATNASKLQVSSDTIGVTNGIMSELHNTSAAGAVIAGRKSRGTRAAPTTVVTGDYVATYPFQPFVLTSGYMNTAYFGARVSGTVTATSAPTQIFFSTGSTDDTNPFTNNRVRMLIDETGMVGIGTTTPTSALTLANGRLQVTGNSTPTGGVGFELAYDSGTSQSVFVSYDRGAAAYKGLRMDGSSIVINGNSLGNVGIGIAPNAKLHISDGTSLSASLISTDYQIISAQNVSVGSSIIVADNATAGNRAVFKGVRSRGTLGTPLVPAVNDDVLSFLGAIYDGVNTQGTAMIGFVVDGTVTSGVAPQRIGFYTSPTTGGGRVERMTIKNDGKIGIGNTGPTYAFDVGVDTRIAGNLGLGTAPTATSMLTIFPSTTAESAFNTGSGVAPTAPVNGDWWTTSTHAFIRLSGVTYQLDQQAGTVYTGTTNRLTVTGTVLDIAATYVGQTSITTFGTITTGTLSTGAVIGGVTMTLGSDASYDTYYRSSGGVLTRLPNGTTGQFLGANTGAAPTWQTPAGGGSGSPGGSTTQLQYNNAGAFGGISGATTNGTATTYSSGNLIATRPKFITSIDDTNGNELFVVTATASAVNEITIANAATTGLPSLTASGGDTNVSIVMNGKGTGGILVGEAMADPFANKFAIQGNLGTGAFDIFSAQSGSSGDASFNMMSARGTVQSPTALQSGDRMAGMYFGGYGTSYNATGAISAIADETFTGSTKGTRIEFATTPIGAASRSTALTIGGTQITSALPVAVPDVAYSAAWDGSTNVPTRNAVYDVFDPYIDSVSILQVMKSLGSSIKAIPIGNSLPTATFTMTDGTIYYTPMYITRSFTATGVMFYQATQGNFTADNNNYIGLFSYSGGTLTQVAITANNGNIWKGTSNSWQTVAFSSTVALTPGIYYIASLYNSSVQTTAPAVAALSSVINTGNTAPFDFTNNAKLIGILTAQTAITTPRAMSTISGTFSAPYFGIY